MVAFHGGVDGQVEGAVAVVGERDAPKGLSIGACRVMEDVGAGRLWPFLAKNTRTGCQNDQRIDRKHDFDRFTSIQA